MEYWVVPHTSPPVVECRTGVNEPANALDLIAACAQHDTDRLLLLSTALPPAFFELRTRFAGDFIQKLINYRLRVGGVFESDDAYPERFREYLLEARHGPQFRAFSSREDALQWLCAR
ncbi:DUF4180 domain-containing protein [Aquabacterium sp. A7-Y]|uniref:DUF4180 domain-containing protein n=1 Tax=Aquabacterium sp. A7-Y TaxID=1349605 RepID=UPI00223E57C9|nr:DUF4180 domain-containing protein [Aquabacterium sp. A7-Y]MCW7540396.1 DUF4180 domain-containing protein [Aquabacterium sp. A7-Y]